MIKVKQCGQMNLRAAVAGLAVPNGVKFDCNQNEIKASAGGGSAVLFGEMNKRRSAARGACAVATGISQRAAGN